MCSYYVIGVFQIPSTPYSMNSLFSELCNKFGGVFFEVCETISVGIWEVSGGNIGELYPETNKKT